MSVLTAALSTALPFRTITPQLAVGLHAPAGWRPISEVPLVILVGVTGVGKSTLLAALDANGAPHLLLPDRRELTDQLIISTIQAADGLPITPVTDRGLRFVYTRRYRALYPGGMAHALAQLWVSTAVGDSRLLFDGLRGANEVAHAASALPLARFVMLDAPDLVRLQRLLGRGDAFDQIQVASHAVAAEATSFAALGVAAAREIFSAAEEAIILDWLQRGEVTADALRAKLQIVIEERQNYDPVLTLAALRQHANEATLYIDTVQCAPPAVATQLLTWLQNG